MKVSIFAYYFNLSNFFSLFFEIIILKTINNNNYNIDLKNKK